MQPAADLGPEGISGRADVVFRQCRFGMVQQVGRQLFPSRASAAEGQNVEMDALEMARRLVLVGISDGTEGVMCLQRHLAQGRAAEGDRGSGEVTPLP